MTEYVSLPPPDGGLRVNRHNCRVALREIHASFIARFFPLAWKEALLFAANMIDATICQKCGAHDGDPHAGFCQRGEGMAPSIPAGTK